MLAEYARFVQQVFPPIDEATKKQLVASASKQGMTAEQHFATQLGERLCQGDIVEGLTFVAEDENGGSYSRFKAEGMLLTNSCDVDGDEWLAFVPCAPYVPTMRKAQEIKRNEVFDMFYLEAHQRRAATVADLSRVQSMRVGSIMKGLQEGTLKRVDMFTPVGHYHFILKLTMHFLRPQAEDEVRYECDVPMGERIRYAAKASVGLWQYAAVGRSS